MSTIMSRAGAESWWGEKLPRHIAYLYKENSGLPWIEVTYKEIFEKKTERQNCNLRSKQVHKKIKPCYIWVFYNDTWIMGGWYLYIKTLHKDYAINFRQPQPEISLKVMQLYPCGVIPVLENFEAWAKEFSKQFHHAGFKRKKNQGLAKCYCELDEYNHVINVLNNEKDLER